MIVGLHVALPSKKKVAKRSANDLMQITLKLNTANVLTSLEAVELLVSNWWPEGHKSGISIPVEIVTLVLCSALESSMADRLHDLARNSIDSVGVSGGGQDDAGQSAGAFSSMFSS